LNDFIRIACAVPSVRPGDVQGNTDSLIRMARQSENSDCDITVFPELSLTAYTCSDLFLQDQLLLSIQNSLTDFLIKTETLTGLFVLGIPFSHKGLLYNCALLVQQGRPLAIIPKSVIPNYSEFYEARWFSSGSSIQNENVTVNGSVIPFGTDVLLQDRFDTALILGVEICEDLWSVIPPSSLMSLGGASVILNLSASNELAGKASYRRNLILQQSARLFTAYAYCSSGAGESSTDTVYGGHCLIAENGHLLAESDRFGRDDVLTSSLIDLRFLQHERHRNKSWAVQSSEYCKPFRTVLFDIPIRDNRSQDVPLKEKHPFIPSGNKMREERCREILAIQSSGLATRLVHTGIKNVVLGISGGLDSTLALLVCVEAFNSLNLPIGNIHCITMPGFGTTARTRSNAEMLCEYLGLDVQIIDISEACRLHLRDLGHDGVTTDITYENAQARERTQILMNKSNQLSALVVGTGDLSELALGWCTYNGDHMSMYAVNSGVPKTLVRYLVAYYKDHNTADEKVKDILADILDTPISPELLPPSEDGSIAQKTEDNVGPYELHDFFLYHMVRCGRRPSVIFKLAVKAFVSDYSADFIMKWLRVFYRRFFSQQFKRSCLPDGPKVGTIALSPRGDWRMPSDAASCEWLKDLDQ